MRRPQGYGQIIDPDRPTWESDTCQCGHCGRVVFVKPGTATTVYLVLVQGRWTEEPGAFCRCCMRPVCLACDEVGTCRPLEVLLESLETGRSASV